MLYYVWVTLSAEHFYVLEYIKNTGILSSDLCRSHKSGLQIRI